MVPTVGLSLRAGTHLITALALSLQLLLAPFAPPPGVPSAPGLRQATAGKDIAARLAAPLAGPQQAAPLLPLAMSLSPVTTTVDLNTPLTLTLRITNSNPITLAAPRLQLPVNPAVRYLSGPGLTGEAVHEATLEMPAFPPTSTHLLTLTLHLIAAPDAAPITLPFQLHTVETTATLTTITLQPTQAQPLPAQAPAENNPTPGNPPTPPGAAAYTGAATHAYNIPIPPGSGGLQPSLTLAYGSRGVDSLIAPLMSDGFGLGWSLAQPQISNGNATRLFSFDEGFTPHRFTLNLNGASYRLQPFALDPDNRHGRYVALGDASLLIEYVADVTGPNSTGEYWRVRTGAGITYRFGYSADAEQAIAPINGQLNAGQPKNPDITASAWKLDRISDLYGRHVVYQYATACGKAYGNPNQCRSPYTEVDVAVQTISYNFVNGTPATVVAFDLQDDAGNDVCYNNDAAKQDTYMTAGCFRPRRVTVHQDNHLVSATTFTYDAGYTHHDDSHNISLHYWFLSGITPYGADFNEQTGSGTPLPAQTFTYAQNTHYTSCQGDDCARLLTRVNNGYGAVTTLTYERWDNSDINAKHPAGRWFAVARLDTWDGVMQKYGVEPANVATQYTREDGHGCYDVINSGCYLADTLASSALVGFDTVTINTSEPAHGDTPISEQRQEFLVNNYWLNGKNSYTALP
ncbi:MAG: hypothetical protein H6650_00255 [Ardenticatenales bacterium]|nr:hypothetical protein [Ardenticatenales bacterium]